MHVTVVEPGLSSDHGSTIPRCLKILALDHGTTIYLEPPREAIKKHRRNMTCSAVRSTRGSAAACPHSRVVLLICSTPTQSLFFCAWSRCTREDKKDHLSSPTAFPFLPTTSLCASPASISQKGIVVVAVLDVHDDVAPSIQSTTFEGSFDRDLLHLQPDPLSIGESFSSSHGGRVAALCN